MTGAARRQLSLYVPGPAARELEAVRRVVDPVQAGVIPAHVTLCREDELEGLSLPELQSRLSSGRLRCVTLRFGRPQAFFGHGILLACVEGQGEFQKLREQVLGRTDIRTLEAHMTLAHPRNPRAAGNSLAAAAELPEGLSITFDTIRRIEQQAGRPWQVLEQFPLS